MPLLVPKRSTEEAEVLLESLTERSAETKKTAKHGGWQLNFCVKDIEINHTKHGFMMVISGEP